MASKRGRIDPSWLHRLLAGIACLASCGDDLRPPLEPVADVLTAELFGPRCATSRDCHTGGQQPERLPLTLDSSPALCVSLLHEAVTSKGGWRRVVPGSCQDSYLMVKVDPGRRDEIETAGDLEQKAQPMPLPPEGPLSRAEIDALCQWIEAELAGCPKP